MFDLKQVYLQYNSIYLQYNSIVVDMNRNQKYQSIKKYNIS